MKTCPWIPVECLLPEIDKSVADYQIASKVVQVKRKLSPFEPPENRYCLGAIRGDGKWINTAGNVIYVMYWKPAIEPPF